MITFFKRLVSCYQKMTSTQYKTLFLQIIVIIFLTLPAFAANQCFKLFLNERVSSAVLHQQLQQKEFIISEAERLFEDAQNYFKQIRLGKKSPVSQVVSKHLNKLKERIDLYRQSEKIDSQWFIDFGYRISVLMELSEKRGEENPKYEYKYASFDKRPLSYFDKLLDKKVIFDKAFYLDFIEMLEIPNPQIFYAWLVAEGFSQMTASITTGTISITMLSEGFFSKLDYIGIVYSTKDFEGGNFSPTHFYIHDLSHNLRMLAAEFRHRKYFTEGHRQIMKQIYEQQMKAYSSYDAKSLRLSIYTTTHENYLFYKAIQKIHKFNGQMHLEEAKTLAIKTLESDQLHFIMSIRTYHKKYSDEQVRELIDNMVLRLADYFMAYQDAIKSSAL